MSDPYGEYRDVGAFMVLKNLFGMACVAGLISEGGYLFWFNCGRQFACPTDVARWLR